MNNSELAEIVWMKYTGLLGSEQIATKLALRLIAAQIDKTQPKTILEIGSGIGTITELIIQKSNSSKVVCYEINDWCLQRLRENITESRILIIDSKEKLLELNTQIDFLIIDDWIDKNSTYELIGNVSPKTIFVEGHRRQQRLFVMQALKQNGLRFRFENFKKSTDSYKGGCLITQQHASSLSQTRNLLFVLLTLGFSKITETRSRIPLRKLLKVPKQLGR